MLEFRIVIEIKLLKIIIKISIIKIKNQLFFNLNYFAYFFLKFIQKIIYQKNHNHLNIPNLSLYQIRQHEI